jgi:uncharacterized repeat protein (TIGR03803 family)
MTTFHPASISKISLRGASIALAFASLLALLTVATQLAQTQTLTVLYKFRRNSDIFPYAGVIRDSAGNLHGTTAGTACTSYSADYGAVFKVDPSGSQTVLHTFSFTDGACPYAPLIRDPKGNIYSTSSQGGRGCQGMGCGTVWKLTP